MKLNRCTLLERYKRYASEFLLSLLVPSILSTMAKQKKPHPASLWKDEHYVTSYELAREGVEDAGIAAALGVSLHTLKKWKLARPALQIAIRKGRNPVKKTKGKRFENFVYDKLPERLQKTWDRLTVANEPEGSVDRIEKILEPLGRRARQELFLYAVVHSNFNISKACSFVAVPRVQLNTWIRLDPDFAELVEQLQEIKKDFFEESLTTLVAKGEPSVVKFANATLNADRGYAPSLAVDVSGAVRHEVAVVDVTKMDLPLDVRQLLAEKHREVISQQHVRNLEEEKAG